MAMQSPRRALGGAAAGEASSSGAGAAGMGMGVESEEELEKLEAEVEDMAEKILNYRRKLPDQLKEASSLLASAYGSDSAGVGSSAVAGASSSSHGGLGGNGETGECSSMSERDGDTAKKIELLKEKTSKNASALPVILKRLKDSISKIDNLNANPSSIHPAFRKERTS